MKNIITNSRFPGLFILGMSMFVITEVAAQANFFNSSRNWSFNRKEVYFGISTTNTLTDLGGGDGPGRNLSLSDMNIESQRFGINGGFRYRFTNRFATKSNFHVAQISGSDEYSGNVFRNSRNLHFRSTITELSQQFEFIFFSYENIRSSRGRMGSVFNNSVQAYLFAGMGVMYYNPQAELNGNWIDLRPLGTEGQNMFDGPEPYGLFTASVPFGIGFKASITSYWRIGVELAVHKTFTDYLDDVSGSFYSNFAAQAAGPDGALSVQLADRHIANPQWFGQGKGRGNPNQNDALVFFNVHTIYNLSYKRGPARAKKGAGFKSKF
jgi:hypothetical protein